ncbi:penicillin-binding protein 2B [Carnobacterium alterfunditum]|uniref:Penicillin-binding protein 2B n=1 Tax=Carnobacterium alterfunditum TaxID=28230 RepID=A0A1N6GGX9_9LACT|nr:penicillin-binding transpeptidase domain-containing protein [Carnobacterium alterfunditum]SIO06810.1 penicillin-binding protein 2B [Carnobacterium alterfunditum]
MNNKNPLKNRKKVAILLFFGTIFLLAVFAGRIAFIMVKGEVNGENLSQNLNNLYTRSSILEANRGTIYDVGGESVALDATSYSLVAVLTDEWSNPDEPQHVVDKKKTAELLEKFIPMSKKDILATLNQKNLSQVEFGEAGKNLSFDTKKSIEQENLSGIVFEETPTRLYPNGIFASHLVGYAALPSGGEEEASSTDLTGMMGIELAYDDLLKGTDGKTIYQKDSFGYVIPNSEVETTEPVNGDDIYLTIDKRMQVYMENVMSEIDEKYNSAMVTATLINPETGAIIATSQRPTFNGTTKVGIDQLWQNLLVENTFEPGSTMKIITLAAAVSEGVFDPNAYYQSGVKMIGKEPIHDHDPEGWGTISYLEGLARSSNVAFANLMEKMSPETWKEYMDAFGLGQTTNSGLANEAKGSIGFKYPLEQANTAFGQGLTVTAVQMLQAFTAIANDGQMMKPQYISKFIDSDTGEETIVEPEVVGEPITEEVAHQTLEYLKEVVYNENGTGVGYQIDGYEIAAKTGTAEIVNPETKQYYSGGTDYIYSVAAMAPADDPKVILYITVQQPEIKDGSTTGSGVVKEIYQPIMKRALEYLSLGEEEDAEINAVEMPKVTGTTKEEALKILEDTQLNVTVVGNGDTIVQQLPLPNKTTIENQRVVLMTNGAMTMPDMMGWSKNDVLKVSEITGLEFTFEGEGYVETQSLEPNANMHDADKITIGLETP